VALGGGRRSGGLRLWKVLEAELKPLLGSVRGGSVVAFFSM